MTKKQRKERNQLIFFGILFGLILLIDRLAIIQGAAATWLFPLLYLNPYGFLAWEILYKAVRNLIKGHVLDETFLMAVATLAAFAIGECSEGVAATLFFRVGELFEDYAVNRSRESIKDLMQIAPEYANVERNGQLVQVDPDEVTVGSVIMVKPGEKVPLDGVVEQGTSLVDTAALTGESAQRVVRPGDEILSGSINGEGLLSVRTTKEYDDSTVAKILELVENASSQKAPVENFITKFAKYYTPLVVIVALALAILSPILTDYGVAEGIRRACIFLVVSCPCALVISVPLSFFGGIGAASRRGILVKGSNFLEAMARTDTIVFDKTGTVTEGVFQVQRIWPEERRTEVLQAAALCEGYSNHPIAASIRQEWNRQQGPLNLETVRDQQEISGQGVQAVVDGITYYAGNQRLMESADIRFEPCQETGTIVYVAKDREFLGWILIADQVKTGVREALTDLAKLGIKKKVMLTGDRREIGEAIGRAVGVDEVCSELLPGDKVSKVEALMSAQSGGAKLAFVGDGINDAPVIMRSDVGIAMGSMGSDAAIEAADVVLMDDDIHKIATIIRISRKTMGIARFNIVFAIGVKVLVLILGALGIANMWMAIFADVGVAVLAILNAMRTMRVK